MIGRDEILRVANTLGLEPWVVEKDYVLGWVLHGIARVTSGSGLIDWALAVFPFWVLVLSVYILFGNLRRSPDPETANAA